MDRLVDRVASVASATPQRMALVDGEHRVSYGELQTRVNDFAQALRELGIVPGSRIAIALPNCVEAVVACYGAWQVGAVVVRLNVQARTRDFARWLSHCGACAVVHAAGHADLERAMAGIATPAPASIVVGHAASQDAGSTVGFHIQDSVAVDAETAAAGTAMIIYTSGTTGDPKGVTLTHANLVANTDAVIAYLRLGASDSVLSVLPFYYAYGASVLHTHLASGACVVLAQNLLFPHLLMQQIASERITGFSGVPSTYALLLERVALDDYDLSSLRYLTQAGGAMPISLTRRLRAALPQPELFVMYGQTEATSRLTWLPPAQLETKAGSVGIPVQDVQLRIVRDDGMPADRGEHGEVRACGPGLMAGYWRNPEASARVLQDGWLRTGDIGYLDAEGFLFLLGRRSDMIKTGAHRVHPDDIEQVIAEVPGVREVAVVGTADEILGQAIKAFVVAPGMSERGDAMIKAHCRAELAPYKIPRHIEFVNSLPRTASGKVQRTQLMEQPANP